MLDLFMPTTYCHPTILVVDDNSSNLDLLCRILSKKKYKIIQATSGRDALKQTCLHHPELILLDIMLPDLDGFEVCRLIKKKPDVKNIPIVFMTGLTDMTNKLKAFELGASDYITKPFEKAELLARLKSQLLVSNLRKTLAQQNNILRQEIDQKYEAEVLLLDINERLIDSNKFLKSEIENRKIVEAKLQQEIVERKQAESKVKQSLVEKDLLLKEIHHRVKNNLFIVSSLLEAQVDYIDDLEVIKMLEDSQNRITSMALIHEQLHDSSNLFKIDFYQYITALVEYINNSYSIKEITFDLDVIETDLNIETAHPCGLIVNELIANSLEHAFCDRDEGKIAIKFSQDQAGYYHLFIKDDGIGFPEDQNFYQSESLGLELVSTLVEQLEGTIEMKNCDGTEINIIFKELNYQTRV